MATAATDGLLLVDKPEGLTSHDVVAIARRALGTRRVGHGGTLDPFATGLLVLLVGRATRLAPYLDDEPKHYRAIIRFGAETGTDDRTGAVTVRADPPARPAVERAMRALTGALEQVPPAFSAKQVGGERAHRAARRGAPLALRPAQVRVDSWVVRDWREDAVDVDIVCGGGTYIRALARDLGRASGSRAHLAELRRLRAGAFDVGDAVTVEALRAGRVALRPALDAVPHLPAQRLDARQIARVLHGGDVPAAVEGARAALLDADGNLTALGERAGGRWRPRVVMRDAS